MKTRFLLFLLIPGFLLPLGAFLNVKPANINLPNVQKQEIPDLGFPNDVMDILKSKCLNCHVTTSKNEDAKDELDFLKWNEYSPFMKVGKLNDICEIISKGKMPPEKYLNRFPEKKLTDAQVKILCTWTKKEATLVKE